MTEGTVAIAGGGLAGLVAARRLAESGYDVRLFEAEADVGGRVRSHAESGFVLDRGFQVLFTAYPAVRAELDLDALDLRAFLPGATIARPGSRSVLSDPFRYPRGLLPSALNREVTLSDKLRTLGLRRTLGSYDLDAIEGDDRSIRSFLRDRGFSRKFVENFAAPFYGGITFDRSLENTSEFVFRYTFAALSSGRIAVPAEGMKAIPEQLAEKARSAGATIHTGETVESVQADGSGASVDLGNETVEADAAVVATDAPTAGDLTGVESIPDSGRGGVTQHYGLPREDALGGDRRLILNATREGPNHVAPMSAVAPEYAPEGRSLLSAVYLGDPDAPESELAERTREALSSWFPERGFEGLELLGTDRTSFAQFDQPPGFRNTLPDVDDPEGCVYLAGEYTRWASIQGAMASGRDAAGAVRRALDANGEF